MTIGPEFDDYGTNLDIVSDLDAGRTIPDELARIWDSEIAILSDQELADASEFCTEMTLLDHDDQIESEISDVCEADDDEDYRTDEYGTDEDLEVALEQCPFDIDDLLDNVH